MMCEDDSEGRNVASIYTTHQLIVHGGQAWDAVFIACVRRTYVCVVFCILWTCCTSILFIYFEKDSCMPYMIREPAILSVQYVVANNVRYLCRKKNNKGQRLRAVILSKSTKHVQVTTYPVILPT